MSDVKKGILVVISGFSGAGKGTLIEALLKQYDTYALSVSATTRSPRPGEKDGVHYFFKTKEEFQTMIENAELIEYAQYVENFYGTPKEYVFGQLEAGKDVILEIEIQGALHVKEQFPEAMLIFITPPSAKELYRRLVGRGTETPEVVANRMRRASEEAAYMAQYDYLVINDRLEDAVRELHELIDAQHKTLSRNTSFVEKIQEELQEISEDAE